MNPRDQQIAQQLKQEIAKIAELVDFRVFGSRARGDAEEDSDLDVFIEVESLDKLLKDQIRKAVWEVSYQHYLFIMDVIFTRDEIENSPLRASPLVRNIFEEGIAV